MILRSSDRGDNLGVRWIHTIIKKIIGLLLAVGGIALIFKTLPFYIWPFILGVFLIILGWQIYIHERYYY
jgi:hypothetical protein